MKRTRKTDLIITCSIFFLIIAIAFYNHLGLKNNGVTKIGTISNIIWGAKNGRYIIEAKFEVKNSAYSTTCQASCTKMKLDFLNSKLLGRSALVLYDSTNANNNFLLLEEETCKNFNICMPDSLKWIDSLVSCK